MIEPRVEETFQQARRMLESKKCVGIKLHPPFNNYNLEDYAKKIFDFAAQFNTVIQIHPQGFATHIVPWADKYPQLNFITAHMCTDHIASCKHRNIYTDTSGGSSLDNNRVEASAKWIGDRIMFGTDTNHAGAYRGLIEYTNLPYEVKYNILRGTAEKLFSKYLNK